jgi:hypothetical protein
MPFYVVQAGTKLYRVNTAGTVATELTLPAGVVVDDTKQLRGAILGKQLVLCNSPSENLWMTPDGTLRRLAVKPPGGPCVLVAAAGGTLTGAYRAKTTFLVKDPITRKVIAESNFSDVSASSAVLATQALQATQVIVSSDEAVNARRLYRTTSGPGSTYFKWLDLDGNASTTVTDGLTDAGLALAAAPTDLGTPPGEFSIVVEWKDRLWAVPKTEIDTVYFSANRKHYAWPATNTLAIKPFGFDTIGVSSFIPRRDELGIGKANVIWKVIGDPPDIRLIKVYEGKGPVSHDATVVINDVAYMLFRDGVYTWGSDGVRSITENDVHPWFNTDTYFTRSRFQYAFARYNQALHAYELCLAALGSSVEDRWVTYHINEKKWLGPHRIAGFTPTATAQLEDDNGVRFPVIGTSNGFLLKMNEATRSDAGTAIAFDVKIRHNHVPDVAKYFGQMSVLTRKESGGTLTITPAVGNLDASDQGAPISHALTSERALLRRLSTSGQPLGRICTLTFTQSTNNQGVSIFGYEIPVAAASRR